MEIYFIYRRSGTHPLSEGMMVSTWQTTPNNQNRDKHGYKREHREEIVRKRENKRCRCGWKKKRKEKTGKEKKAWKRKRMKKIFARFGYHTLMIHVVLFYRVRRQNVPLFHHALTFLATGFLKAPPISLDIDRYVQSSNTIECSSFCY